MIIEERTYSADGQHIFARLSGDYNPLHVDAIRARREMFGGVVVHGMNVALTALDAFLRSTAASTSSATVFSHLSVRFLGPIYVGDRVVTNIRSRTSQTATLVSEVAGVAVVEIKAAWHFSGASAQGDVAIPRNALTVAVDPQTHTIEEMLSVHGSLDLYLDLDTARTLYPHLANAARATELASLLAVTRLVGMEYPGMQSVFQSFNASMGVATSKTTNPLSLQFQVSNVDARFGLVGLHFEAPDMEGTIQAFVRPEPQTQPKMEEVCELVKPLEFAGQSALIVGGSRGLGETCAKILAAGGGFPTITYNSGGEDARRVTNEIRTAGYSCNAMHCDVRSPASMFDEMLATRVRPTQLYYFATPKIGTKRQVGFSRDTLNSYLDFYVDGFAVMCREFQLRWDGPTSVFYPSTVFVTDVANRMEEYASAKAAGETVAHYMAVRYPMLRMIVERLPRVATDQTLSLIGQPAESALPTLLPIVRNMSTIEPRV